MNAISSLWRADPGSFSLDKAYKAAFERLTLAPRQYW
jgi:hypothetical protein